LAVGCGFGECWCFRSFVLEPDHVLIAVTDLAAATPEIEAQYGPAPIEGGRDPRSGTANWIVPVPNVIFAAVVELVSRDDRDRLWCSL
jgi:Glyoxalase-like domain